MGSLGDFENVILSTLQQPGANFGVGTYPQWASLNNPQYGQAEIDYWINEGYRRAASDLADLRLTTAQFSIAIIGGVGTYAFPPMQPANPYPKLRLLLDVTYVPTALQPIRFEPNSGLVSWEQFNRETGQGYLRQNSTGLYPRLCSLGPQRNTLEIYPNPTETGDLLTGTYAGLPTSGSAQIPTLLNQSDTPLLPDDCDLAIIYWAISNLKPKNNTLKDMSLYRQMYKDEIERIRELYIIPTIGDTTTWDNSSTFPTFSGLLGYM